MNSKIQILSTKLLNHSQKEAFQNSGILLVEKDFIKIETLQFQLENIPTLLLFTSQNAVESVLKNEKLAELKTIPAICVGIKTREKLENIGFKVLYTTDYAKDLAPIIKDQFSKDQIAFFAGNLRRDILPNAMKRENIQFIEYQTYVNELTSHEMTENFDGILFFSPSGVESYLKENSISKEVCFCIGTTTGDSLIEISENIQIAEKQTIDSVVENCLIYFGRKS